MPKNFDSVYFLQEVDHYNCALRGLSKIRVISNLPDQLDLGRAQYLSRLDLAWIILSLIFLHLWHLSSLLINFALLLLQGLILAWIVKIWKQIQFRQNNLHRFLCQDPKDLKSFLLKAYLHFTFEFQITLLFIILSHLELNFSSFPQFSMISYLSFQL